MLKKIAKKTVDVVHGGEVVASVGPISPAIIAQLLVEAGEDLAATLQIADDIDAMRGEGSEPGEIADKLLQKWPSIVTVVGTHLPGFISKVIAHCAGEPEQWKMVEEDYSLVLQFDILVEIAKITFVDPEGFRRFVGNVLALVDLSRRLTRDDNTTHVGRPSSAGGSTTSSQPPRSSKAKAK